MLQSYLERIRPIHATPISSSKLISEGMVNDVVVVNDDHIYRFPKHDWAFGDMRHEARCLALLRNRVDVSLPNWTIHGDGDLFVGYSMIKGETLQTFHLTQMSEQALDRLAAQIGRFLHAMHTIPADEIAAHKIQPSLTNRTYEKWIKLYEAVQTELFPHLYQHQRTWVHQFFQPLLADQGMMNYSPCFMNGDLSSYHLLFDPETELLSGIIDFGTAGVGDPAADFACLLDQYGEPFVARIGRFYGDLTHLIDRARWWAGTLELQWALGGIRNPEDPSWFTIHIGRARGFRPILNLL